MNTDRKKKIRRIMLVLVLILILILLLFSCSGNRDRLMELFSIGEEEIPLGEGEQAGDGEEEEPSGADGIPGQEGADGAGDTQNPSGTHGEAQGGETGNGDGEASAGSPGNLGTADEPGSNAGESDTNRPVPTEPAVTPTQKPTDPESPAPSPSPTPNPGETPGSSPAPNPGETPVPSPTPDPEIPVPTPSPAPNPEGYRSVASTVKKAPSGEGTAITFPLLVTNLPADSLKCRAIEIVIPLQEGISVTGVQESGQITAVSWRMWKSDWSAHLRLGRRLFWIMRGYWPEEVMGKRSSMN